MSKYVLLIDDDQDDAEIFSDALKALPIDANVEHFDNGREALTNMQENTAPTPDVIFLDINMPAITGWECLREIKAIASLQQTPIVMFSTCNFEREGINAADVGATALLTKPPSFEDLKTKLYSLLAEIW